MVEENTVDYGKLNKKIVFTENDHRHAQLIIRLRHDNLKQSQFFRAFITGYLNQDERIMSFIEDLKTQSNKKKTRSKKLRLQGKQLLSDSGFSDEQLDDLFDLIAEEHPEL
tara:strand:+ start:180 stop:512 length:333 start_codon:yes stop_codon:yes gene_type:complete